MMYNSADMPKPDPKRTIIETTADARRRLRVLAAKSDMTMREYLDWLAQEAERRELLPPTTSPSTPPPLDHSRSGE